MPRKVRTSSTPQSIHATQFKQNNKNGAWITETLFQVSTLFKSEAPNDVKAT